MRLIRTALCTAIAGLAGADLAVAQQTITFSGPTPPVTVTLTPGSNIDIQTDGNVAANCVPGTGSFTDRCQGMPTTGTGGGGGNPPTVSIAASGFSTTPDGEGKYTPGTSFTITPTVGNGLVCQRRTVGSPGTTTWPGVVQSPFGAVSVTVTQASSTYGFDMKCYNDDGSAVSNQITVLTNAGGGGGGQTQCSGNVTPPSGYTRNTNITSFTQLPSNNLPGQFISDFPASGSDQGRLITSPAQYVSIQFTAPLPLESPPYPNVNGGTFNFTESQVDGDANLNSTYITISQCAGDFRIPANTNPAPLTDPTFANGCRNIQFASSPPGQPLNIFRRITYTTSSSGTSTGSTCQIIPGQTYFFNLILADPRGDIAPGENTCNNQLDDDCGIQMNIE
jgi:hypothetical protein